MTSEKPKHFIINCETGERTEVEFTDAEILEMQNNIERATIEQAEREAAEEAKANANLQSTGLDNAGRENLVFSKGEPAERSTVAPTSATATTSKKKKNKKKKNKNATNNPVESITEVSVD